MAEPSSFRARLAGGGVLAFAHRGDNARLPENSLAAFQSAAELGFDLLETDIRASLDGVLYCFHDDDLLRMTGEKGCLEDLGSGDIDRLSLAGGHRIARLENLFEAFPGACFNLDAKSDGACQPLGRMIARMGVARRVCVGSYDDRRIGAVIRAAGTPLCTSLGRAGAGRFYLGATTGRRERFDADCVQLPVSFGGQVVVTRQTIDHAHVVGLKLHVWTVNDRDEIARLLDLGVDGVMSDDCRTLKSVLNERGQWR